MKVASAAALSAVGLASVAAGQSATTVFGPNGGVGNVVPDSAVLDGIDSFTEFGLDSNANGAFPDTENLGEVLFFANGGYYVGGAGPASSNPLSDRGFDNRGLISNNNAYGVFGPGRSDIVFDSGVVQEVIVQARGTAAGDTANGGPLSGTTFEDAEATILLWSERGIEVEATVSNADFEEVSLDVALLGPSFSVTRVSIINEGPANSAAVLGELTVTGAGVPAPGTAALVGIGGLAAARRRR